MTRAPMAEPGCELDPDQIDELGEVSGDEQHVLIWCDTHEEWEWHWLDVDLTGEDRRRRERASVRQKTSAVRR